jgi:N-acetylglucosaminyldiphosphoundecaprenol N-acetyl-beta-D-mannosaminyltransferase
MAAEALPRTCTVEPVWGIPVVAADLERAAELVLGRALAGTGGYACFCNVHVLVAAQHSEALRTALGEASLVFSDGWPVAWIQRGGGATGAERIAGADLMQRVFDLGTPLGLRHFLFGSTPPVLERLRGRLLQRSPEAQIVGTFSPAFAAAPAELDGVAAIRNAEPDLVWCALGALKQELWMLARAASLAPAFVLGVGAAFDFLSGAKVRAPRVLQRAGLEWLHRLVSEPRRLTGRYARTNTEFAARMLAETLRQRSHAP